MLETSKKIQAGISHLQVNTGFRIRRPEFKLQFYYYELDLFYVLDHRQIT